VFFQSDCFHRAFPLFEVHTQNLSRSAAKRVWKSAAKKGNKVKLLQAQPIDYLIIAAYFVVVLGIGAYVSRRMKSSEDFFESGRSLPAWVAGLALMSANLGAFELLGFSGQGF